MSNEQAAFAPLDNQRLVLGHLREGVPDQRAVPLAESVGACSCHRPSHSHAIDHGRADHHAQPRGGVVADKASSSRPVEPTSATSVPSGCSA